jgi:hypothetical protein
VLERENNEGLKASEPSYCNLRTAVQPSPLGPGHVASVQAKNGLSAWAGQHGTLPPAARLGCKAVKGNCELEAYLWKVAPGGEVMVAISNVNLIMGAAMLKTWIESVQQARVGPWMVLAIDEALKGYLDAQKIPNFLIKQEIAAVQQGTGSNHAVSALKFGVLAEFLKLGWNVLLSDVDVVTVTDPFPHLYRDRDIEGATLPTY